MTDGNASPPEYFGHAPCVQPPSPTVLRNKIYYTLKPLIPDTLRMWLRRGYSRRVQRRVAGQWPVLPGSERPPAGWPGWPGGKKFAVVLTHDVEGPRGLAKCRQLMQLERECGFVSSYNFIPEGPYQTPSALRDELVRNGFEVGVHDLHHDGRLYDSADGFNGKAHIINQYLKDWGARGFRSGFMLNNLDWLHQLEVAYDASTFDTDPFEPQPQGQGTIFPFWVPGPGPNGGRPAGHGYVELPYTLVQDSTLFLLLGETSPDIWIQKADWVAAHGGMVLVNVHPDYVDFDRQAPEPWKTFPVDHYRRLLHHLRARHGDSFWQPVPRDMAAYISSLDPKPEHHPARRVVMVTHSYYEMDGRVQRYAQSLAARGDEVHVLALRQAAGLPNDEIISGVHLHRVSDRFGKPRTGKWSYLRMVLGFLRVCSLWILRSQHQRPIDLLHIHNMPDFLVLAGLYPKLRGAAILLDIHDLLPEFFNSKFAGGSSRLPRSLRIAERLSASLADHVIVANDLWLDRYARRTRTENRSSAWINYVDGHLFHPRPSTRDDDKLIVMFPGGLYWHQGVDLAIRAFPAVVAAVPNAEFHIYGEGDRTQDLINLTHELGLERSVRFLPPVPSRDIAPIMAQADLAVVPKRADSFGNEAYSTKIMEFMALGVPVVASTTRIDTFYFNDSIVRFFESGNVPDLAQAMIDLLQDPAARAAQARRAQEFAAGNTWQHREQAYFTLIDGLCDARRR